MINRPSVLLFALLSATATGCASTGAKPSAPAPAGPSSLSSKTAGMQKSDGFIPIYLDDKQGKVLLELPRDSMRALMFVGLATGLGSNPIGLDRGAGGDNYVTRFERNGQRFSLEA